MSQPQVIDSVIKDMGFKSNTKSMNTLVLLSKLLTQDLHGNPHDETKFKYRSVIGKLNFLEKLNRADLSYAMHQCARFSSDLRKSHTKVVNHFVCYLISTKDQGLTLDPKSHSFECWTDADFARNWNKLEASFNVDMAHS